MDSPFLRRSLAAVAITLMVILAVLWWLPRRETREIARAPGPAPAPEVAMGIVEVPEPDGVPIPAGDRRLTTLEDYPDLKDAPPLCQQVVLMHRRNVPAWSIEKNMDAQAMKFDDAEMACLEEKGVPDQILDRAVHNRRFPQPARSER